MSAQTIDFYGAEWCGDCRRSKKLLTNLGVEFNYLDVEHDEAAQFKAIEITGKQSIPVIVFGDGTVLIEPSDPDLKAKLQSLNLTK
jgi:glutaredoxin